MWPFKKRVLDWVTTSKKVERKIYFNDGTSLVLYAYEYYTKLPEWEDAKNYHYEARARSADFQCNNNDYITVSSSEDITVIPMDNIKMITYKVKD